MEEENKETEVQIESEVQIEENLSWRENLKKAQGQEQGKEKITNAYDNVLARIKSGEINEEQYNENYKDLERVDRDVYLKAMSGRGDKKAEALVNKSQELQRISKEIFFINKQKRVLGEILNEDISHYDEEDMNKALRGLSKQKLARYMGGLAQK